MSDHTPRADPYAPPPRPPEAGGTPPGHPWAYGPGTDPFLALTGQRPYPPSGPPPGTRTDGLAISAFVTGLAGLGLVPPMALAIGMLAGVLGLVVGVVSLVLGIVGLRRTRSDRTPGGGLAVAGIVLGGIQVVVGLGLFTAFVIDRADDPYGYETFEDFSGAYDYGDSAGLDALWDECDGGDMQSCDDLFHYSPIDSVYEDFGATCGFRSESEDYCVDQDFDDGVEA